VSVNVGEIREIEWRGRVHRTAIAKEPVSGRRKIHTLGIDGDVQGDRSCHGGIDKAVYAFASEHCGYWAEWLGKPIGPGAFGENLTLEGVTEDEIHIGDRLRIGSALLEVSEPRQPCQTFAALHQREDLPKSFADAGWPGIYFRVIEAGDVGAGDAIVRIVRGSTDWTVRRVFRMIMGREPMPSDLDRLLDDPALSDASRQSLVKRRRAAGEA
jgi:MOSC domain-containing protein YiiM